MKFSFSKIAASVAIPAIAQAHYSQRVWVDVDAAGKIQTYVGPPGSSPAPYTAGQFSPGRVFARDMGDQGDVAYTTLQGGTLASDGDTDDDGVNYQTDFPGYEAMPFHTGGLSGTFTLDIVGQPLFYQAAGGKTAARFVPVSTAFAGQTLPYITVGDSNGFARTPTDDSTVIDAATAFSVGSHGHPDLELVYPDADDGSTAYDGVYALRLRLESPGYIASDPFYLILGNDKSLATVADAGSVAIATLVPEPASLGIAAGYGLLLTRRRRPAR